MPSNLSHRQVLPGRIGPASRRLRRTGHLWMIAGYALCAWVVVAMPRLAADNTSTPGDVTSYVILGYLCGIPLFAGLPWMIGFLKWRNGREHLVLTGKQLRVVGAVGKGNVFDLTSAKMAVELIGGRRENNVTAKLSAGNRLALDSRSGQGGAGPFKPTTEGARRVYYSIPYHPVLVLYRERDDFAIPVELCDVKSRQMRDPRQTLLLAQAMATSTDPQVQFVAGQLRTIAHWRQLPEITDADPQAVPASPPGYPETAPVIPTPVRGGTPAPEIQIISGG